MKALSRKLAILAATAFAIASPILQSRLDWGLSAKAFADDGDSTLRAAGYGFSIWGLIYAGLIAFAVFQLLPRNDGSAALKRMAAPAVIAITGVGAWIWASAADLKWLSVVIITVSAAGAIAATLMGAKTTGSRNARLDRMLLVWPLAALAGWLTVATALNVLTVMTAKGLISGGTADTAALVGIAGAGLVALAILWTARVAVYGLPVAWGLIAVFVAERAGNPQAGWTALAAAAVILFASGAMARR